MSEKTVFVCDGCGNDIETKLVRINFINNKGAEDVFNTYAFAGVELNDNRHLCPACTRIIRNLRSCNYTIDFVIGEFDYNRCIEKFKASNES